MVLSKLTQFTCSVSHLIDWNDFSARNTLVVYGNSRLSGALLLATMLPSQHDEIVSRVWYRFCVLISYC